MKHSSVNFRPISVQPARLLSGLRTGFPRGRESRPITRCPAEGRGTRALRSDLLLSSTSYSSFFFSLLDQYTLEFGLQLLASLARTCDERGFGGNERGRKRRKEEKKERKEGEKLISHKVPVDVSEEGVAHDVSKACLRVAAQTLLGVLRG